MSYFEDNGIAIFVGGKNDEFGVLSDISILDMETLVWNRVECYGYRYESVYKIIRIENLLVVFTPQRNLDQRLLFLVVMINKNMLQLILL